MCNKSSELHKKTEHCALYYKYCFKNLLIITWDYENAEKKDNIEISSLKLRTTDRQNILMTWPFIDKLKK